MGTITVTISDEAEQWLRKTAGKGKGKLGKKLTEAVANMHDKEGRDEAAERLLRRMDETTIIGAKRVTREELHER
jgi:hypothetical protein